MGTVYSTLSGVPPVCTSALFRPWYIQHLLNRLNECPLQRATTYYFSQSGSDGADGLTPATAKKTIGAANTLIASGANIRLRFKRGDVWKETSGGAPVGLLVNQTNVTVDDYGTQSLRKPLLSAFAATYTAGSWTLTAAQTNTYEQAETNTVAWIREEHDINPNYVYRKMTSIATVEATAGSWWWDSVAQKIYIHPFENRNPSSDNHLYEAVYNNAVKGISTTDVDNVRLHNLRVDGYGCNTADLSGTTPTYNIHHGQTGSHAIVITGCEAYYGNNHNIGQNATGAGGIVTMIGCKTGYTNITGTDLVVYSSLGGQEAIYHECESMGGKLPIGAQPYSAANAGDHFTAHASNNTTSPASLFAAFGCWNRASQWQDLTPGYAQNAPTFSDLKDCRAWIMNHTFNVRVPSAFDTSGTPPANISIGTLPNQLPFGNTNVVINSTLNLAALWDTTTNNARGILAALTGIFINTTFILDFQGSPGASASTSRGRGLIQNGAVAGCTAHLYNCRVHWRVYGRSNPGVSMNNIANNALNDSPTGFVAKNTIFSCNMPSSTANFVLAAYNAAANLVNNAYAVTSGKSNQYSGYDQDPALVELGDLPFAHPLPDSPLRTSNAALVEGVYRLEYDADWSPRDPSQPAIGPLEPLIAPRPSRNVVGARKYAGAF